MPCCTLSDRPSLATASVPCTSLCQGSGEVPSILGGTLAVICCCMLASKPGSFAHANQSILGLKHTAFSTCNTCLSQAWVLSALDCLTRTTAVEQVLNPGCFQQHGMLSVETTHISFRMLFLCRAPKYCGPQHDLDSTQMHRLQNADDFWAAFERRYGANELLVRPRQITQPQLLRTLLLLAIMLYACAAAPFHCCWLLQTCCCCFLRGTTLTALHPCTVCLPLHTTVPVS